MNTEKGRLQTATPEELRSSAIPHAGPCKIIRADGTIEIREPITTGRLPKELRN